MEWEEINRRLRNGTSVSVLAELAGTTYKNMYNRIRRREQIDGKQYLKPEQLKRPYKAQGGRKKAASVPEEPERVTFSVAIEKGYNCMNCDNLMRLPADRNLDGALFKMICAKAGTESPDENTCCCNYVPMPNDKKLPEFLQKKLNVPEVEPIGEEKAPARPEVVEKVAGVPEVVREFAGIPEGVVKDTLESYRQSHADAVKQMHDIEDMYKEAKRTEMQIRAICFALERLLEGGSV